MQQRKTKEDAIKLFPDSFARWLPDATDDELEWLSAQVFVHQDNREQLVRELLIRQAHKGPHWTLIPGFFIALLAMVFAAIAAWPTVRDWIWAQVANKGVQTELVPVPKRAGTPIPSLTPTSATSSIRAQPTSSPDAIPTAEPQP